MTVRPSSMPVVGTVMVWSTSASAALSTAPQVSLTLPIVGTVVLMVSVSAGLCPLSLPAASVRV